MKQKKGTVNSDRAVNIQRSKKKKRMRNTKDSLRNLLNNIKQDTCITRVPEGEKKLM